jgi:5-methylcytosine-specific restriction endonuclease McrA
MGMRKGYKQTPEHIAKRIKRGPDHPNWVGGLVTKQGGRTRALRLFPDLGPCSKCGSAKSERHHADGDTSNNAESNVVPLCRQCHLKEHPEIAESFRKSGIRNLPMIVQKAAEIRKAQTHCRMGHEYTEQNTYVNPKGARICTECRSEYKREWRRGR